MNETNTAQKFCIHYISGTHWDREWYRPFQEFRYMLIKLLDNLLELMEQTNDFLYFHLDGQTCLLEDYMAVRPQNRSRLESLIHNRRILIGPWFTLPDLFCVGDEALIRNLLMGFKTCDAWGASPMPVAYTCDMFGHPSQMPQIYCGFDLPYCVLGRGTNEHTTPAFFTWQSPDGSSVFCFKLQDKRGYGAFCDTRWILEGPDAQTGPKAILKAKDALKEYLDCETGRSNSSSLCFIDAQDHLEPAVNIKQYIRLLNEIDPDVKVVHSNLPDFFANAQKHASDLQLRTGELREPAKTSGCAYLQLIPNCPSSRIRLKQANDKCLTMLINWAEPFLALANLFGAKMEMDKLFDIAWRYLLLNHAHDSICGCSIDQTHKDMQYRFDQAEILARQICHESFGYLTSLCADLAEQPDEFTVTVANPTPFTRHEVMEFDIDFPLNYPAFFQDGFTGAQKINSFILVDTDGNEVPYQILSIVPNFSERTRHFSFWKVTDGDMSRYRIAAKLNLPALGFDSLLVKPCQTPMRRIGSLRTGPFSAENVRLIVKIESNGTLTLTDKNTNQTYHDLLIIEDCSEIGDGWFHSQMATEEIVLSCASPAQVSVIHDGLEMVTFRVCIRMDLPRKADRLKECRSDERVPFTVVHLITLRRDNDTVNIETSFDNSAEDHRVRLLLPTDVTDAVFYYAHQPFDIVKREIALDKNTETWRETEISEKPFLGYQAVCDAKRGLAFICGKGLHEGGVIDDKRRTLSVTLLRSFRRTWGTSGEYDALEKGPHRFSYIIAPCCDSSRYELLQMLEAHKSGILVRQTGKLSSGFPAMSGTDMPRKCFIELLDKKLMTSSIKPTENGNNIIIRLWNPANSRQIERVKCPKPIKSAKYLKLSEKVIADSAPAIKDNILTVDASPHEITTILVEF
jgi:alpha-mannosidase/mannosylglycerate hydrolase